jgi:DNA-directed RNA polymerase subunit RPC12/RpoP
MNLLNFVAQYPDEASCKAKWKLNREKEGVVCPHCGGKKHYWKKDKENYECKVCGYRQSLKANTVMHGSNLPFRYWFIAIHLLTSTKKSFSALELQRQLGHKRYEPIWQLLHKLRSVMGKRDSQYSLLGILELDEGFFTTEISEDEKHKPLKRGRGSQKKSKVLVMAESMPVEGES